MYQINNNVQDNGCIKRILIKLKLHKVLVNGPIWFRHKGMYSVEVKIRMVNFSRVTGGYLCETSTKYITTKS